MIHSNHTIRNKNISVILQTIIIEKEISRADLSKITGLNKPSVSEITKKLIDKHIILETGYGLSGTNGGRKPVLLTFNTTVASCIAINIDKDVIRFDLRYIDGSLIKKLVYPYAEFITKIISFDNNQLIKFLCHNIDYLLNIDTISNYGIQGISIAVHGIVYKGKIVFTPNYALDKLDLFSILKSKYDIPIFINNEANLSALGEYTFSSTTTSLVCISIHSGIGAGIISNGEMLIGTKGYIGEIGHSIISPNGKECPCGNRGCLEQYISKQVMYNKLRDYFKEDVSFTNLINYWKHGESFVTKLLEYYINLLSIEVNNIICMFDPPILILNSKLFYHIPELINYLKEKLTNRLYKSTSIKISKLNDDAISLGCISIVARDFLKIDCLKLTTFDNTKL